jgi:hydrogenase maturation protein HypF
VANSEPPPSDVLRVRVTVRGAVQGVGFRPFVYRLATEMGLAGWVNNSSAGVFVEAEGPSPTLQRFVFRLENEKPAIAIIQSLEASYLDPVGFRSFEIRESESGENRTLVMPDLATCPACIADIFDPANRRHRYPFTNCTSCGPRFSIIAALPYDRDATTMRHFEMCEACRLEYGDPKDRRFHAQPNACPTCGPQLALWDADGNELASRDQALRAAAEEIRAGKIVAVKGLGGFHLMADGRNEAAVQELRMRKHREEKPFALMVPSFEQALRLCHASPVERRLLRSPECPIVLLRRKTGRHVAVAVAPENPTLGVMLPYAPLHHLLLAELGFPVVATSGNISDEPLCTDENEALARLRDIADLFLVHNRPILRHVDDSIVREVCGRELVIRRARGFAPLPVQVEDDLPAIVAFGAHQKNTIAAAVRSDVFISQHVGDLETEASFHAFERTIDAFRGLYDLRPTALACDAHPDYLSSQHARQHAHRLGLPVIEVQHHLAHAFACMAENQLSPPVLAITWDGSGMGSDGTVWGGEFLHVTRDGFRRIAHLRPFLLPGNAKAVREPRRVALALLYEIFGDAAFELDTPTLRAFSSGELTTMKPILHRRLNAPVTTSMGRLFDAFASLVDVRQVSSFEGQAAMELEFALAEEKEDRVYPYVIRAEEDRLVLDWEPMVRALLAEPARDRTRDQTMASVAFHNTLVDMAVAVAKRTNEERVLLSGGCFQNRYLTERLVENLRVAGLRPYWHQRVPPNDGGISLGQILAAKHTMDLRKE